MDKLAAAMKTSLETKRLQGRTGWPAASIEKLVESAGRHTARAGLSMQPGNTPQPDSLVDAANYLAFAYDVAGRWAGPSRVRAT